MYVRIYCASGQARKLAKCKVNHPTNYRLRKLDEQQKNKQLVKNNTSNNFLENEHSEMECILFLQR